MATFLASGEVHDDYQEEAENDDRKLGEKAQRHFRGGGWEFGSCSPRH